MVSQVKNRRQQLRDLYGFDFPEDLFRFWNFVNRLAPLEPLTAVAAAGLHLVGPFEVLAGRFDGRSSRYHHHLHWRYVYDPPEFFTVLHGGTDALHYGYYLDDPLKPECCVAYYYANDAFELEANCDTLFEALRLHLEQGDRDNSELAATDPKEAAWYEAQRAEIGALRHQLLPFATADRSETGESYVERYHSARPARFNRVVAATRDQIGIVVPPETYRPLSLPNKKLWALLDKTHKPTKILKEARAALADGYPGTALKLGKDIWATAGEGQRAQAYELLDAAYAALGRGVLRQVLAHHREHPQLPRVDILDVE